MTYLLIGSDALNYYREKPKAIKDHDLIADIDTAQELLKSQGCTTMFPINKGKTLFGRTRQGVIWEVSLAWEGTTNAELLAIAEDQDWGFRAPLDVLYALKMSHRYLKNSPHFLKTMRDIREMRKMGATIPEYLSDWFKRREKETYDYSHPNLDQGKTDFFSNDGLVYVWDHDSLHEAVALTGKPMYKNYQKDGSEVLCDRSKWEALSFSMKCCGVYEEACVLALERSIVPHPGVLTPQQAFELALMKVCTNITSGWFREFAWENYDHILSMYSDRYVEMFNRGLENGVVKPHVS